MRFLGLHVNEMPSGFHDKKRPIIFRLLKLKWGTHCLQKNPKQNKRAELTGHLGFSGKGATSNSFGAPATASLLPQPDEIRQMLGPPDCPKDWWPYRPLCKKNTVQLLVGSILKANLNSNSPKLGRMPYLSSLGHSQGQTNWHAGV